MIQYVYLTFTAIFFLSCSQENANNSGENSENDSIQVETTNIESEYWQEHKIDSAVLYVYYSDSAMHSTFKKSDIHIITGDNELNPYVADEFTRILDSSQVSKLQNMLTGDKSELDQGSGCFEPHHGFVMWDKHGNQLGHISVCLACENYHVEPKAKQEMDIRDFQKIIESFDIPSNYAEMKEYAESGKWSEHR